MSHPMARGDNEGWDERGPDPTSESVPVLSAVVVRLDHDFNTGRNEGGFHEAVLPAFMESNFRTGDIVELVQDGDDPAYIVRGRIRCLVAVVEPIEEAHRG